MERKDNLKHFLSHSIDLDFVRIFERKGLEIYICLMIEKEVFFMHKCKYNQGRIIIAGAPGHNLFKGPNLCCPLPISLPPIAHFRHFKTLSKTLTPNFDI